MGRKGARGVNKRVSQRHLSQQGRDTPGVSCLEEEGQKIVKRRGLKKKKKKKHTARYEEKGQRTGCRGRDQKEKS